jgi:anti-sigma B factor antagonist
MRVELTQQGEVGVLEFQSGEVLDSFVAADVKAQAFRLLEGRSDLVVDLSNLEFVDSAGLGVLVGIYKRTRLRNRTVVVAGAQPYVGRVMKILKLDRVFDSYPDVPSAIVALEQSAPAGSGGRRTRG